MPKIRPRAALCLAALFLTAFQSDKELLIAAGKGSITTEGPVTNIHVESDAMTLYTTNGYLPKGEQLNCLGRPEARLLICNYGDKGFTVDGKIFSELSLFISSPGGIFLRGEIEALQNFVAVAGRLYTNDFMANRLTCSHLDGEIINDGQINVGGSAYFIAKQIKNNGLIASDTIVWASGGSVYLGSESEHMRVRLTYDKDITPEHIPFVNQGRLTAKGRIAFRSGDPYTQAFVQGQAGVMVAKEVEIDAPSNVALAGHVQAPRVNVRRVHELKLDNLKTSHDSTWDLVLTSLACRGTFQSGLVKGTLLSDASFEEVRLSKGLWLDMPRGRFISGALFAPKVDLKAREWLLDGNAHIAEGFDGKDLSIRVAAKACAITSEGNLILGPVRAQSNDLRLEGKEIGLTGRMDGLGRLVVQKGVLHTDHTYIELKEVDIAVPWVIDGETKLVCSGDINLRESLEGGGSLRLKSGGEIQASRGIGLAKTPCGALVIEEAKGFVSRGPIFVKSIHYVTGSGKIHVMGAIRAPKGIRLRTSGDLTIDGPCDTRSVLPIKKPKEGEHGGAVFLKSVEGNVTVHDIDTRGAPGFDRGGDGGAISLLQSDGLKYSKEGAYVPAARLYLRGNNYLAVGGLGAIQGESGDIKIGNSTSHFPDRCPACFESDVRISGRDLTFGFNTGIGFKGSAELELSGGLYLSDMLVVGNLSLAADAINVYPHAVGRVTLSSGAVVDAAPTQIVVLGDVRSSVDTIRIAPAIDYEALPIDTREFAKAYRMDPERLALVRDMLTLGDTLAPSPGQIYLQSMTPSVALIAPLPELMGEPPELQEIPNDAAAPMDVLAEMISTEIAGLDASDLAKWEAIRSEIMKGEKNPATLPIDRYQRRMRYAIFEPSQFVYSLGRSAPGRSALSFIEQVNELIQDLKALKAEQGEIVISHLKRFTQPPQVTAERWQQIRDAVSRQFERGTGRLKRGQTKSRTLNP